jgi:hypothetical protein
MKKLVVVGSLALTVVTWAARAEAQCATNADCRGGRVCVGGSCVTPQCTRDVDCPADAVCENGTCVAAAPAPPPPVVVGPAPAPAPVYVAQPAPVPVEEPLVDSPMVFYGGLAGLLAFHGWGAQEYSGGSSDFETGFGGGLYASAYYVLGDMLHFGGYVQLTFGNAEVTVCDTFLGCVTGSSSYDQFGLGVSAKFGAPVGSMAWIGGALDLGVHVTWDDVAGSDNLYGIEMFPRFDAEVIFINNPGFKLGMTGAIGPRIIPYETDTNSNTSGWAWLVDLTTIIGINFGF